MKSVNNDGSNNNGWLGFSLAPHMNMEVSSSENTHHPPQSQVPAPSASPSFFHSAPQLNYGIYYGADHGETGALYSPLSVMPLKSDGSLCIMEALNRSQPQAIVTSSTTPKLEDFFASAALGTHQYETSGSEAMALSLDSMFYSQTPDHNEPSNQNCLNHLEQKQIQAQQYPYFSGFRSQEMLLVDQTKDTHQESCNLQLPNDGLSGIKNWVSRSYPNGHAMAQKMMGENGCESSSISALAYGDLQSLSLSMSPGSQSSCVTVSQQISPALNECVAMEAKKRGPEKMDQKQIVHRKSIDTFGQRTSQYRGVTRHRWTGRYEAHLWDNSCKKEGQSRKGRQVYLGGYDMEEKAARAYDLAALKYWGPSTHINFPLENYQKEVEEMKNMTRQEYVAHLRRKSSGFSRGASMYRGVTRHHQHGRWQARIGRVAGNKDLYLGTFSTQEEAAEAYDIAAIKFRGINAVTNFDISRYDVEKIMASNTLLSGELARRSKDVEPGNATTDYNSPSNNDAVTSQKNNESDPQWKMVLYQSSQQIDHKAPHNSHSLAAGDMIGINSTSSGQQKTKESTPIGTYLSNPSSLVTSLSSSREGTPDKGCQPMASSGSKFLVHATSSMNSWIPASQLRPALSLPHLPVFSAWTDG